MGKKRKIVLYSSIGVVCLIAGIIIWSVIVNGRYRSQIPQSGGNETLSQPVRQQIEDAYEKAHREPSADNLGHLGMVFHSSADYEKAAVCYELAAGRDKSSWIWNYYLGYLGIEMGESESAVENFTRVMSKDPGNELALYYAGIACKNLREYDQAEELLGRITAGKVGRDNFPLHTYARFELSRIYCETDRIGLAEETLKGVLQESPSFGPAYRLLGNIYTMQGDNDTGSWYRVRANDHVPFSPPVDTLVDRLVLLSRSELFLLKRIDEAQRNAYHTWTLRLIENALQHIPGNKFLVSKAIKVYLWLGMDEKAGKLVDQHIELFQDNFIELYNMGTLFYANELYAGSAKYLILASSIEPDNVELQKKLVICYWFAGEKQKYQELLDDLLDRNRDDPDILADIANFLFFNLKETEKAVSYLPGLRQRAPGNPKVLKLSAGIAEKSGNLAEAIRLLELSFKGDPEDISTIKHLGNILYREKLWEKSISHYREALVHHPNEPYFLERLGTYLATCPDKSLRNTEEGIEYLERAFLHMATPTGSMVEAGRSLAWTYANLGEKQKAINTIKETIIFGRYYDISPSYLEELKGLHQAILRLPD